ncbi:hypothetical protein CCP2SC5_100004 [Azospirillaceae bacterium]
MLISQIDNLVYDAASPDVQKAIDRWLIHVQDAGNWKVRKKRLLDVIDAIGLIFFKPQELGEYARQIGEAMSQTAPARVVEAGSGGEEPLFIEETQEILKIIENESLAQIESSLSTSLGDVESTFVETNPAALDASSNVSSEIDPLEKLLTEIKDAPLDACIAESALPTEAFVSSFVADAGFNKPPAESPANISVLFGENDDGKQSEMQDSQDAEDEEELFPLILSLYVTAILERLKEKEIICAEQSVFYMLSVHRQHQDAVSEWLKGDPRRQKALRKLFKSDRRIGLLMTVAINRMNQKQESAFPGLKDEDEVEA